MREFLCYTLEFMILLPALLLACLPMRQYLKLPPWKLTALAVPFILLLCLAGGSLCYFFSVNATRIFVLLEAITGFFYLHVLNVTKWKSVSVFLAVCGIFSCLDSVAYAIDIFLCMGAPAPWLSLRAGLLYNLTCWIFVGAAWYPATHAARKLLEEKAFAQTWYIFWCLPILFIILNRFLTPVYPDLLLQGRSLQLYITNSIALLFMLLLIYGMFYLMAKSLNINDRLRQENLFLTMQQARYDSLRTAIAETREARHDMRHHFNVLQNLAGQKEWESLKKYLSDVQDNIPDSELGLCNNPAVDGIAGHYRLLCRKQGIPISFRLDLPRELPVPEIEFCLVLSNLLENALEASLRTIPEKRQIKMQAYLHSEHMILLTVENTFDGNISEKAGVFQSSKHRGEGIGIQSVRHIAEKSGGDSRFLYENGIFCANVILQTEG